MAKPITINTKSLGKLSISQYRKRVKSAGSKAAFAREVGVDPSTVRTWGQRLEVARTRAKATA